MENAVDALKMAFAVMVFVGALSITVYAFSEAKTATDTIIANSDREQEYYFIDEETKKQVYYTVNRTTRIVSLESIVPTIYRAFKENYKVVFKGNLPELYIKIDENDYDGDGIKMHSIDLPEVTLFQGSQDEFLDAIMYRRFKNGDIDVDLDANTPPLIGGVRNKRTPREYFKSVYGIKDMNWNRSASLYEQLKGKVIEETLGTFYQDDELQPGELEEPDPSIDNSVPDANKTKKRVIIYDIKY